jgi:oligopeptidase B
MDHIRTDSPSIAEASPTHHPPIANKIPVKVFEKHGAVLVDDYHWFSNKENNQVMKHLEDENVYTDAMMEHTTSLQDTLYEEFTNRALGDDVSPTLRVDSYYYYKRYKEDSEYPVHCRKYESMDNAEQVVLDENAWAEGEDYFSIGALEVNLDHSLVAFSTDTKGDERFCIMVKDASSDKIYDEEIYNTYFTLRWAADHTTFFYTRLDRVGRSYQLLRHTVGLNKYSFTQLTFCVMHGGSICCCTNMTHNC